MADENVLEDGLQPFSQWYWKSKDKLDGWRQGRQEGVATGFEALDSYFRLVDGEMLTIAARPSMGKTTLAMQIVEHMAKDLRNSGDTGVVAVYSAEQTGWSLFMRMAGALAGVNVTDLRMGKGLPSDFDKMDEGMLRIKSLPIHLDDRSSPTTASMREAVAELNMDIPVRGMMFDFMELAGDEARGGEERRISQIAIALKQIAKDLSIPVIALSQLNRQVEERKNKLPGLADLRHSGQIEQVSDIVCFIMRPEYYFDRDMAHEPLVSPTDSKGVAYINIAKNRHGQAGKVRMAWRDNATFANLERVDLNNATD